MVQCRLWVGRCPTASAELQLWVLIIPLVPYSWFLGNFGSCFVCVKHVFAHVWSALPVATAITKKIVFHVALQIFTIFHIGLPWHQWGVQHHHEGCSCRGGSVSRDSDHDRAVFSRGTRWSPRRRIAAEGSGTRQQLEYGKRGGTRLSVVILTIVRLPLLGAAVLLHIGHLIYISLICRVWYSAY